MENEKPNILLLVLDTLRVDFLSCFNESSLASTPCIDEIAEEGTMFENAFTAGPNTEISHGALFTGKYPSETGMVGGSTEVPHDIPLLAEHLKNSGYKTFGISGPGKIRSELGFDRGFERYVEPYKENIEPSPSVKYLKRAISDRNVRRDLFRTLCNGPDDITNLKLNILGKQLDESGRNPFFGFVNLLTVHTPYNAPRPYLEKSVPSLNRPRWFILEWLAKRLGFSPVEFSREDIRPERIFRAASGFGQPFHADDSWLTELELKVLRQWYQAEVEYLDSQIGEFFEFLRSSGQKDNTILILTADHGEHLGEHGLLYHGGYLFDETLHVPLIINGPDIQRGKRQENLVSLIDIFPTVTDLIGTESPGSISGQSVFSDDTYDAVFAEHGVKDMMTSKMEPHLNGEQLQEYSLGRKCVRTKSHKLVSRSDGEWTLYTLPEETECNNSEIASQLLTQLTETLGIEFLEVGSFEDNHTPEVKSNLQRLGYLE